MMPDEKRLKILFLPAWYPSEVDPLAGIFVQEHAKAASLYNDVVVLYAYGDSSRSLRLYRISETVEGDIRTARVRYGGGFSYLWMKLRSKEQGRVSSPDSEARLAGNLIKLLGIPKTIIEDLLSYVSLFVAFRKLAKKGGKADIIHAHGFTAGVPAVILGRLCRIPVVITEHASNFPVRTLSPLERVKARFAFSRAVATLPVSNNLREAIKAYGVKTSFKVIPNAVNTEVFYPPLPHAAAGEARKNQGKKLLLVAVLTPIKGVPFLLEALSQIRQGRKDFSLDIVGDGPNRQEYEELSRRLELNAIVNFHGLKPKEEVAQFMRNCDFYVQPSLVETFGVVYIEAMACGKPVIASRLPVLEEIVNEDVGILVPPKDVKALKEAIEDMLDNYKGYSPEKIAQYASERFSYGAVGKMLDEIYRGTLASK